MESRSPIFKAMAEKDAVESLEAATKLLHRYGSNFDCSTKKRPEEKKLCENEKAAYEEQMNDISKQLDALKKRISQLLKGNGNGRS